MDVHALHCLEFEKIREMLAEHASSSLGRSMAMKLRPVSRADLVQQWGRQAAEMNQAADAIGLPPFGGLRDIREMIRRAIPPAKLEPEEFSQVADSLAAGSAVCDWARRLADDWTELKAVTRAIGDFRPISEQIRNAIDARGRVRDDATPRLDRIRRGIAEAHTEIEAVVRRLLKSPHVTKWLRYAEATFHDDRLVLPLAAEHRGRVPGIIHRTSGTGATLFVEPADAVELNNTIVRLRYEESEEITRILWHLTHLVHANAAELLATMDALAVLDLVTAKVRLARAFDMTFPRVEPGACLRLRNARHPLLMKMRKLAQAEGQVTEPVVPIDMRLGDDFDMLVVTGPNTGGKTVALKTVGLLVLMTQAGMPIPADEGASLPIYEHVWIDVGDEQSLQQSLSTFSAHLKQLLRMLERATKNTLVLVDELGAGTDPDEGAAIARAVVEQLLRVGCHGIVTTHLSVLKSVAFTHPRADNGAVEFDVATLRPTYRLIIGEPGNSNALEIAERLGMPKAIVQAARGYLSGQDRSLQRAIDGTIDVRRRAEQARTDAETVQRQAETARSLFEREKAELERQRTEFNDWTRALARLKPGDPVSVRRFDREGTIVRVNFTRQTALVSVGALELEVPLAELRLPPPG